MYASHDNNDALQHNIENTDIQKSKEDFQKEIENLKKKKILTPSNDRNPTRKLKKELKLFRIK